MSMNERARLGRWAMVLALAPLAIAMFAGPARADEDDHWRDHERWEHREHWRHEHEHEHEHDAYVGSYGYVAPPPPVYYAPPAPPPGITLTFPIR